jgi:hypothetical protein
VRFFPKNKFRVITPNQSLLTTEPTQPPPLPPPNSFLSQLLAVTIPSISALSPRRSIPSSPLAAPPSPQLNPDESWEVPGHEGEISLIASSVDFSRNESSHDDYEQEGSREESVHSPWSGVPEIHSSPLALPLEGNTSRDTSVLELPSADWHIQGEQDVSNLLSQRFCLPDNASSFDISLSDDEHVSGPALPGIGSLNSETLPLHEVSDSVPRIIEDSDPTIRRPLPGSAPIRQIEPQTPTPGGIQRGYSSIFADMSAEQADLSWPLLKNAPLLSPDEDEVEDTIFHSAIYPPSDILVTATPKSKANSGDLTQFFDCTSTSPLSISLSMVDSPISTTSTGVTSLLVPTKAVFEAHNAHTKALRDELELYRDLAGRLQADVVERDSVLADLNLRLGNKTRKSCSRS